jgi:hypothetical protein
VRSPQNGHRLNTSAGYSNTLAASPPARHPLRDPRQWPTAASRGDHSRRRLAAPREGPGHPPAHHRPGRRAHRVRICAAARHGWLPPRAGIGPRGRRLRNGGHPGQLTLLSRRTRRAGQHPAASWKQTSGHRAMPAGREGRGTLRGTLRRRQIHRITSHLRRTGDRSNPAGHAEAGVSALTVDQLESMIVIGISARQVSYRRLRAQNHREVMPRVAAQNGPFCGADGPYTAPHAWLK